MRSWSSACLRSAICLWDWHGYLVWFHLCIGAAYAFHVTLTFHALQTRQTDITGQGYLFSAVMIFLGNVGVLLLGIPLLTAGSDMLNSLRLVAGRHRV